MNIGDLFKKIIDNWKRFEREFLIELEHKYLNAHEKYNITSEGSDHIPPDKVHSLIKYYPFEIKKGKSYHSFPFPDYYVTRHRDGRMEVTSFYEECHIDFDDSSYDLFFAIHLGLLTEREFSDFIEFHLENNFQGDRDEFSWWLEEVFHEYPFLVKGSNSDNLVKDWIANKPIESNSNKLGFNEVRWTGSSENKTQFIQLLYGLYYAGFIDSKDHEITKVVDRMAEILSVDLPAQWRSNLSKAIHNVNLGHAPGIFDQIKNAYLTYAEDQVNKKKNN